MITRRFVLTGLVAAPAVIAADKLMKVRSIPAIYDQPYGTVYGVGWDLEVVEFQVWTKQEAMNFAKFGRGGIDLFREITDIVYHVPMEPLPMNINSNFHSDPIDPIQRLRDRSNRPYNDGDTSMRYYLAEDMGPSARVGIWDPSRPAKEDEKPHWAKYDYVNHSRKLGRDKV
jgi:hypothetical protein